MFCICLKRSGRETQRYDTHTHEDKQFSAVLANCINRVTHPQVCDAQRSSCWLDPPVNDEEEKVLPIVSAMIRIRSTITWASFWFRVSYLARRKTKQIVRDITRICTKTNNVTLTRAEHGRSLPNGRNCCCWSKFCLPPDPPGIPLLNPRESSVNIYTNYSQLIAHKRIKEHYLPLQRWLCIDWLLTKLE